MRTPTLATLSLVGLLLGAAPARGEDAPDDPGALLRKARTAEGVDRDVARAMELYQAVVATGGASDAAREAAMRLADLQEVRGERTAAVETLKLITERFGDRLDDDGKRHVHEALARLLPAGSHARSPLGDVYVLPSPGSASNPSGSPLEAKILAILSRLDDPPPDQRASVEWQVNSALEPVGMEALPVLERVMNGERPERARFAAQAYGRLGKAAAIAGLVKTVREGDGFARASAIGGLAVIPVAPGVSAPFVAAVAPLLDLPQVQDRRQLLRQALAPHLSDDELLAREAAGGPDASYWLSVGISRKLPAAVRRVEAITKQGGPLPEGLVSVLVQMAGSTVPTYSSVAPSVQVRDAELPSALRFAMLEAVAAQPPTLQTAEACASIAGAIRALGVVEAADRAAEVAWVHALGIVEVEARGQALERLTGFGVPPSTAALSDPRRMERYLGGLGYLAGGLNRIRYPWTLVWMTAKPLHALPGFWEGVAGILKGLGGSPDLFRMLASAIARGLGDPKGDLPPPPYDGLWLDLLGGLSAPMRAYRIDDGNYWMLRAAARSGRPAFLALLRKRLASPDDSQGYWLAALGSEYRAPDRIGVVVDLLLDPAAPLKGHPVLAAAVRDDVAFYRALLPRLSTAPPDVVARVLQWMAQPGFDARSRPPPAEVDALWLPLLRRKDLPINGVPSYVYAAFARLGSSDALALAFELATDDSSDGALASGLLKALTTSKAQGRESLFAELLLDPRAQRALANDANVAIAALAVVEAGPQGPAAVRTIARAAGAPGAPFAVRRLAALGDRATLAAILSERTASAEPGPRDWRLELIRAAEALHLKEAIPFLLTEFRRPEWSAQAATAMDTIRAYHERLATFEGYGKGDAGSRQDVIEMLDVEDPDIRRAAVLSYGALLGKDALPRLLKIAKDEKDEGVRKAALETIERIARSVGPAPDAKPSPAPPPAMGEDGGMK